jgi:dCMP deaminase
MKKKSLTKRISWNQYFFKIAQLVSERSTCLRQKEGAVVVKNKRILTAGYNGAPTKLPHCLEIGCLRKERGLKDNEQVELCRGLDAVQNAVIQAAIYAVSIRDSVLYTTCVPSITSTKIIINAGIKKIFIPHGKLEKIAASLLKQSKVKIRKIK